MNNKEAFYEVNIRDYVKKGLESGLLSLSQVEKFGRIFARKGILDEEIKTIMANGLNETINFVKIDPETNEVDWVVTNPGGEQYIVKNSVFRKKYEIDPEDPKKYKPKGDPVLATRINENICFKAPWGETMYIKSGGYLIVNSETDIYGIQEEAFLQTYKFVDNKNFKTKTL